MTDKPIYIYRLIDPRDSKIRYIGKTEHPKKRYSQHCNLQGKRNHRRNWLTSLRVLGLKPVMEVIEVASENTWRERERFWIAHYRALGVNLTNIGPGGESVTFDASCRAKIKESWKRRTVKPLTAEQRKRQADALRGRRKPPFSAEHLRKLQVAHASRGATPEFRQMRSEIQKRLWDDPEYRARMVAAHIGKGSGNSKKWVVTFPDGSTETVENLTQFCREKGLARNKLHKIAKQGPHYISLDGWRCRPAEAE